MNIDEAAEICYDEEYVAVSTQEILEESNFEVVRSLSDLISAIKRYRYQLDQVAIVPSDILPRIYVEKNLCDLSILQLEGMQKKFEGGTG